MPASCRLMVLAVCVGCLWQPAMAAVPPQAVQSFLRTRCIDCHEGPDSEGGLDIAALSFDPEDPGGDARWARIIDRVEAGEMPPPDDVKITANKGTVCMYVCKYRQSSISTEIVQ